MNTQRFDSFDRITSEEEERATKRRRPRWTARPPQLPVEFTIRGARNLLKDQNGCLVITNSSEGPCFVEPTEKHYRDEDGVQTFTIHKLWPISSILSSETKSSSESPNTEETPVLHGTTPILIPSTLDPTDASNAGQEEGSTLPPSI